MYLKLSALPSPRFSFDTVSISSRAEDRRAQATEEAVDGVEADHQVNVGLMAMRLSVSSCPTELRARSGLRFPM